ncbi:MAG: glycosyl transferase family 8, partial [Hyphomicrobiales bacterium]|nr:glycosyl transferase family 8 [Hyphomicrobiales bacterium]
AFNGVWKMLDARWNVIDHFNNTDILEHGAERRPWILHFATWKKPWDYRYPNLNGDYYDSFRSRTLFARTLIEKRRDALREHWTEGKRFLKRAAPIRIVWEYIRG